MRTDELPLPYLYGFLQALARVSAAFLFVPIPGLRSGPEPARIVLTLGFTLALFPVWPVPTGALPGAASFAAVMLSEALLGVVIGLGLSFLFEGLQLAAQFIGLQVGYSYSAAVDPVTQAESTVLLVMAQLLAGLLFFAMGLDRSLIRLFAWSFEALAPGQFAPPPSAALAFARTGAEMFATGLRLALPVIALLILVDVALALLGRLNSHLQLLTLAFPIKMLTAVVILAWSASLFPALFGERASAMFEALRNLLS